MNQFKKYKRTNIAEMREVTNREILTPEKHLENISISQPDLDAGSPKKGDMIARNPKNHDDKWLVAAKYFEDNFDLIED